MNHLDESLSDAGMSVGYRSEEGPTVFHCRDFSFLGCCETCHKENFVIAVYPWSAYSVTRNRMPDLGLGLRAEICCGIFNQVRLLPREWWIRQYAKKKGWTELDAARLTEAPPEKYYKVWGQIADSYSLQSTKPRVSSRP